MIVHLLVYQCHGQSAENQAADTKARSVGRGISGKRPGQSRSVEYADTPKIIQDWNAHGLKTIFAADVRKNRRN
jgi:hypothetical protein